MEGAPPARAKRDDELWHRFSSARTSYTRRRKTHFAELDEKREGARVVKERLLKEAEALSTLDRVGSDLEPVPRPDADWKAAGAAPREVEEDLWQRFRAAQDTFFGARDAANAEQDREFAANAEKKKALLVEAEALLPVTDLEAAKRAFRDIAERWDAAGKVPRDQMKSLEARIRKVEQAIRSIEDDKWRRSDPEKSARADDMLGQLERAIADIETNLEKARAAGDDRKVKELEENLASRQQFLEMARKAARDFSLSLPTLGSSRRRPGSPTGQFWLAARHRASEIAPRASTDQNCPVGALGDRPRAASAAYWVTR